MLTRWVNISDGHQRVRFKYMKQKDLKRFLQPLEPRRDELREMDSSDMTEPEKYERYKLNKQFGLKEENLTNLIANKAIMVGLYAAFKRARLAADRAVGAFEQANFSGVFSKTASDPLVKSVMKTYFRTTAQEHVAAILAILKKTRTGLHGDIVIADCAGREMGPYGGLAEGIVPLKNQAMVAMNADLKKLDQAFDNRVAALSSKYSGKKYHEKVQELRYGEKPVAEAMLMHEYLEQGETGSIHVEFSYCTSKSVDAIARIIFHEATHKFGAAADFGYASSDTISKLKVEQALLNADSYAFAALSLLRGGLTTPQMLDSEPPAIGAKENEVSGLEIAWRKKRGY